MNVGKIMSKIQFADISVKLLLFWQFFS